MTNYFVFLLRFGFVHYSQLVSRQINHPLRLAAILGRVEQFSGVKIEVDFFHVLVEGVEGGLCANFVGSSHVHTFKVKALFYFKVFF